MLSAVLRTTSAGAGSVYSWTPHLSPLSGAAASINLQTAHTQSARRKTEQMQTRSFCNNIGRIEGKKCFSSDRRWSFWPVWFFLKSCSSLICGEFKEKKRKEKKILLFEAQKHNLAARKAEVFRFGMQASCDSMPEVSLGQ